MPTVEGKDQIVKEVRIFRVTYWNEEHPKYFVTDDKAKIPDRFYDFQGNQIREIKIISNNPKLLLDSL